MLTIMLVAFAPLVAWGLSGGEGRSPGAAGSSPSVRPSAPPLPSGIVARPPGTGAPPPSAGPGGTVGPGGAVRYHVDCQGGRDDASGRTPERAWRTLARASRESLAPGDTLLLRAGCSWQGPLDVSWSGSRERPITVSAYGTGPRPIIKDGPVQVEVSGSWLVVEGLALRTRPPMLDASCDDQPAGRIIGVRLAAGSSNVTVRDIDARGFFAAIRIDRGSSFNRILDNELHDNDMKSDDPTSDAGALGVDVLGDDNEIAGNRISGSDACSPFFSGRDGSAIHIFGGRRNVIHHNTVWDNNDFMELGDPRTADTTIAYNSDVSRLPGAAFLVVHGEGTRYGPVARTTVFNNSAYLSGRESYAIQCTGRCGPDILSFRDNIVWAEDRIGYAAPAFDEGGNIYWRSNGEPRIFFDVDPSSRLVDPGWRDPEGGDLRLSASSPAIDTASGLGLELGFDRDLGGTLVPVGAAPDVGAREWSGEAP